MTSLLGEGSIERDTTSSCIEQSELNTKNSAGFSSLLSRREGKDEYYTKVTTSILTLSDERVGSGGDDIESTTLTSLSKGRVGRNICSSLSKERVGSTEDGAGSTTLSTNGRSRDNLE